MEKFWGPILGVIIFCGIKFLFDYISEKEYEHELTQPDEVKYIKKDDVLDNYLSIFRSTIGNPYKNFTISKDLYKQIKHNFKDPFIIRQLINQILVHLCLPIVDFKINVYNRNEKNAGEYISSRYTPTINLYIKDTNTAQNIISVVCHECTHHFMYMHNMNYNNNNEFITDALAIYLGFGKYIRNGYAQQKRIIDKRYEFVDYNTTSIKYNVESSAIGYLNLSQIEYLTSKIKKLKYKTFWHSLFESVNFLGKAKKHIYELRMKEIDNLQLTFLSNYKIHLEIIQRNSEIIDLLCNKKFDKMLPSDAVQVQNCILNINAGTYYSDAELLKNSISKCNIRKKELKSYIKKLSEQSTKLTLINTNLAKYL